MPRPLVIAVGFIAAAMLSIGPAKSANRNCAAANASKADSATIDAGRKAFIGCASCHEIKRGKSARIGPSLGAMFDGRPLVAPYNYSQAFRTAKPDWTDAELLDDFLAKPSEAIPGTKMIFAGISKDQDRKNMIAYLKSEAAKSNCK